MAGGLSKLLTAAEVMRLAEQKKLKLEAPIQAYLPDFSMESRFPPAAQITLRSLLAHHSGLPCFFLKGVLAEKPMSLEELVSGLKQDAMVEPPQTLFRFSYLDYDLLGRALEVIRGGDFPSVMKKDVLEPLGMDSSNFDVNPTVEAGLARGYRHGKEIPLVLMRDIPVSGMATTANDLSKFLRTLFTARSANGKPWLREKTIASMFEPQYPDIPLDFGEKVGLGWMLSGLDVPGAEQAAWQEGSLSPYYSQMTVLYKQQLGVVLLSNTSEAQKIGKDIAVRALKLLLRAKYGVPEKLDSPKTGVPKEIKVNPLGLDAYAGLYSAFGQATQVERHGTHFSMRLFNAGVDLVPVGENLFMPRVRFLLFFHYDFPNFMMRFETVGGKQAAVLEGLPVPVAFEKFTPGEFPKGWEEGLGEYTLDNPDDAITLSRVWLENKEGILTASLNFSNKPYNVQNYHYDLAFLPVSDTEAVVPGLFLTDGGTLRLVKKEGQTKLFYSGYWFTLKKHSKE
jgi:CubicO group peptidase (beta-lactamase class C family)